MSCWGAAPWGRRSARATRWLRTCEVRGRAGLCVSVGGVCAAGGLRGRLVLLLLGKLWRLLLPLLHACVALAGCVLLWLATCCWLA